MTDHKHDQDKAPVHLLPVQPLLMVARVRGYGDAKYAPGSCYELDRGRERFTAAAIRHLFARLEGDVYDPESGLPHLAHAACSALLALWYELKELPSEDR